MSKPFIVFRLYYRVHNKLYHKYFYINLSLRSNSGAGVIPMSKQRWNNWISLLFPEFHDFSQGIFHSHLFYSDVSDFLRFFCPRGDKKEGRNERRIQYQMMGENLLDGKTSISGRNTRSFVHFSKKLVFHSFFARQFSITKKTRKTLKKEMKIATPIRQTYALKILDKGCEFYNR